MKAYHKIHPLHQRINGAIAAATATTKQKLNSNLENLMIHFPEYLKVNLEHISPYVRPPWWSPPFNTEISVGKRMTARSHAQLRADELTIYTDGSAINDGVGAAIYCPTTETTRKKHLGTSETHNIYGAELTAHKNGN